jgi:hypothetical protein
MRKKGSKNKSNLEKLRIYLNANQPQQSSKPITGNSNK